ncbi:MAG: hypothetical protein AAGI12_15775 [Pseudomonadota bacterium]
MSSPFSSVQALLNALAPHPHLAATFVQPDFSGNGFIARSSFAAGLFGGGSGVASPARDGGAKKPSKPQKRGPNSSTFYPHPNFYSGFDGVPLPPAGDISRRDYEHDRHMEKLEAEVRRRCKANPHRRESDIRCEVYSDDAARQTVEARHNGEATVAASDWLNLDALTVEQMLFDRLKQAFLNDQSFTKADLQRDLDLTVNDIDLNWPTAHRRFTLWQNARAERRGDIPPSDIPPSSTAGNAPFPQASVPPAG